MTCIIGLEHEGSVFIGADSAVGTYYTIQRVRTPKVFQRSQFLIGSSGSVRMGQLLQYSLEVEELTDKTPIDNAPGDSPIHWGEEWRPPPFAECI